MTTIAFHTLGCKLNFAESSDLLRRFVNEGFTERSFHQKADVYVINTCTVTAIAEKKGRNAIRLAHKLNPDAIIAVIGCYSQVNAKEIEKIEGVDIILGNDDKHSLIDKVKEYINKQEQINCVRDISKEKKFYSAYSYSDRTRGFLKVQDGCDYFCTYCEIPFARGRSRSCSIEEAVNNAKILSKENFREVVLTGINIGDFGKHTGENFLSLLKALDGVTEIDRYRISSIEPNLLTKEIIDFCKDSRAFMPHFHIPLQSGSNVVLKNMQRKYQREEFAEKVLYINEIMPNAFIACDVMTGFNSETDKEFESSVKFLENLPLAFIHVFTYSLRPNTKANSLPKTVEMNVRRQRSEILNQLAIEKKKAFYRKNIGITTNVLWEEQEKDGFAYGFSDNYIRVQKHFSQELTNTISQETLTTLSPNEEYFIC